MANVVSDFIKGVAGGFFGGPILRDYTHASKTFRPNFYQNAPKLKFLFHVYFEINPEAYANKDGVSANWGLAVKSIKLPSFSLDTHVMNQYNRKRIVQSKIKYEQIEITFHDDAGTNKNGGMIRDLWKNYYQYYYADSKNPRLQVGSTTTNGNSSKGSEFNNRTQYNPSITGDTDWGYTGEPLVNGPNKVPFFKSIRVYGFNQHNYASYILVNPIITKFGHDTYNYAEGNGTMENHMTIDYETVVYDSGAIAGSTPGNLVTGFGSNANYDTELSPIARPGSQNTIIGPGGLVDAANGFSNAIASGNYLGAIQIAGTSYNTFKNTNLSQTLASDVKSQLASALAGTPNQPNKFNFPSASDVSTAAQKIINKPTTPPTNG